MSLSITIPSTITLTITNPVSRQIVQRNGSNLGTVQISGTYSGSPNQIQAAMLPLRPYAGTTVNWTAMGTMAGGNYSGTLTVSPGWYKLVVRAFTNGLANGEISVLRVGCGEVFITGGQSNSIPYASTPPQFPLNDNVSFFTSGGSWSWGADPGPNGTIWPGFMDTLATYLQMPVAVVMTGVANTSIADWVNTYYVSSMKPAIQYLPTNGFRAVLFMIGETDATGSTSQADFTTSYRSLISMARADASFSAPWGQCVTETFDNGVPGNAAPIAAAQTVISTDLNNFAGPNTDSYTSLYRNPSPDGVHFNSLGLQTIGPLWTNSVKTAFSW